MTRRDRCTLHKKHLEAFRAWLNNQDAKPKGWWKVLDLNTSHPYEVLRAEHVSESGSYGHSFIYRNDHNDHLTVQKDLVPKMLEFLNLKEDHFGRYRKRGQKA